MKRKAYYLGYMYELGKNTVIHEYINKNKTFI